MSLKKLSFYSVVFFSVLTILFIFQHEYKMLQNENTTGSYKVFKLSKSIVDSLQNISTFRDIIEWSEEHLHLRREIYDKDDDNNDDDTTPATAAQESKDDDLDDKVSTSRTTEKSTTLSSEKKTTKETSPTSSSSSTTDTHQILMSLLNDDDNNLHEDDEDNINILINPSKYFIQSQSNLDTTTSTATTTSSSKSSSRTSSSTTINTDAANNKINHKDSNNNNNNNNNVKIKSTEVSVDINKVTTTSSYTNVSAESVSNIWSLVSGDMDDDDQIEEDDDNDNIINESVYKRSMSTSNQDVSIHQNNTIRNIQNIDDKNVLHNNINIDDINNKEIPVIVSNNNNSNSNGIDTVSSGDDDDDDNQTSILLPTATTTTITTTTTIVSSPSNPPIVITASTNTNAIKDTNSVVISSVLGISEDDDDDNNNDTISDITQQTSTSATMKVHTNYSNQANTQQYKSTRSRNPPLPRGKLMCNHEYIDSEVIYWKHSEDDSNYISPLILPKYAKRFIKTALELQNDNDDKDDDNDENDVNNIQYLTFEYDHGGWNNMRMSMENILILAHITGRTLVIPPHQQLYLLSELHHGTNTYGFEDFFNTEVLKLHRGLKIMSMSDFLKKEGMTGRLHGIFPPKNRTDLWGRADLWPYLDQVADVTPEWAHIFLAFPLSTHHNYTLSTDIHTYPLDIQQRYIRWLQHREGKVVYYDESIQNKRHMHFPGDGDHRVVSHFYNIFFFADTEMQRYYRRFVRDYIRYKDEIFCIGHDVIQQVRQDAIQYNPTSYGQYYALHIRRGDFQYKDVKISAQEIWDNLHYENGTAIIPDNAFVYISTDDPKGICTGCLVQRKPCETYPSGSKPVGCPEDTSWNAFLKHGWKLRFLNDYMHVPSLKAANPNYYGMIEVIVSSRAQVFAGTLYSTFTGYIHRLRGYHGLELNSYYHSKKALHYIHDHQKGLGWWREWSDGWTDDHGNLIP